jgi:hypothetical protein
MLPPEGMLDQSFKGLSSTVPMLSTGLGQWEPCEQPGLPDYNKLNQTALEKAA